MEIEEIVKKAKKGDSNSFNQLILYYEKDLYNIARSRLYNEDDVCDAVQETIIKAFKSINKLINPFKIKQWILRILINECNKIHNVNKKNLSTDIDNENVSYSDEENTLDFISMMNVLDYDEKTIFILYYDQGYSTKEISKILKINHNTVRSKILRGKEKIKNTLEEL